jgi:hypothetical protein
VLEVSIVFHGIHIYVGRLCCLPSKVELESEDPKAMLHNILTGEGFYKTKVLKCIVFIVILLDISEEEKQMKDVEESFTKWYNDETIWV